MNPRMVAAREKRIRELTRISNELKEFTLAPEMDEDARALYWVGPWDYKRWVKDEKGKYKKDDSGENYFVWERDPMPAIHIHLGAFRPRPSVLQIAGAHRCLGFLEDKKVLTSRYANRNWHRKLHGYTVNVHILQNAERFGFEEIDINGKSYSVKYLLTCPRVPRKDSGGYENNLLLVDPENLPNDQFAPSRPEE